MKISRIWLGAAMALSAGCATQAGGTQTAAQAAGGSGVESHESKLKIANQSYFDLANCFPRKLEIPAPATVEAMVGYMVAARPQIMECLVDPQNRGPEKETQISIKAEVTDAAVT